MGIQVVVSVWPTVDIYSENFEEMKEKGYLVRTEHGVPLTMLCGGNEVFFDATNPDARTYVWEKIKKNYYDQGAKLFWLDVAEPEYSVYDFKNYRYQLGSVQEVGNIYPKYYLKAFYDGMTAEGDAMPISLIRSAWAGSAKYGALVWSGDIVSSFECFQRQVQAGLNMAVAGGPLISAASTAQEPMTRISIVCTSAGLSTDASALSCVCTETATHRRATVQNRSDPAVTMRSGALVMRHMKFPRNTFSCVSA